MKIDHADKASQEAAAKTADLVGIILTGGQSSRMGSDKSRLWYFGKAQYAHLFELLSGLRLDSFLSCNEKQARDAGSAPIIQDVFPQSGPMGGILSAFLRFPDKALLTVPCDLPFLDRRTISTLIEHRNPDKIATTFITPIRDP